MTAIMILTPFSEALEEGLGDERHADGEGAEREEHEDQHEEPLGEVHRRHLRGHRAHHAQGPVEAEDLKGETFEPSMSSSASSFIKSSSYISNSTI